MTVVPSAAIYRQDQDLDLPDVTREKVSEKPSNSEESRNSVTGNQDEDSVSVGSFRQSGTSHRGTDKNKKQSPPDRFEAVEILKKGQIEAMNPDSAAEYFKRGELQSDVGRASAAIYDFRKALENDPEMVAAHYYIGLIYRAQDEYDDKKAIEEFSKAIEKDPQCEEAYLARAITKSQQGDKEGAIADYTRVIEVGNETDNKTQALSNRGTLKYEKGDLEGATSDFSAAIELDPEKGDYWAFRAESKMSLGRFKEAEADLTKAIDLKRWPKKEHYSRGIARARLGKYEEAIADFKSPSRLDADFLCAIGVVRMKQGDYEKAISKFNETIEKDPQLAEAFLNRGKVREKREELEKALLDYMKTLTLDSEIERDEEFPA
ncbi:MAG: tetratricopeptide repeat protein [Candidatus Magasanikbacteria bacterium]